MFKHLTVFSLLTLFLAISISAQAIIDEAALLREFEITIKPKEGVILPDTIIEQFRREYISKNYYRHYCSTNTFKRDDAFTWYVGDPVYVKADNDAPLLPFYWGNPTSLDNDGDVIISLLKTHPCLTNPSLQIYKQSYANMEYSVGYYDSPNSLLSKIFFPPDIVIPYYWMDYEIRDSAGNALGNIRLPSDYFMPYMPSLYDDYYKFSFTKYKEYKNVIAYKITFGRYPYEDYMFPRLHEENFKKFNHEPSNKHYYEFYLNNKNVAQDIFIWFDKTTGKSYSFAFKSIGVTEENEEGRYYYENLKDMFIDKVKEETDLYNDMMDAYCYFPVNEDIIYIAELIGLYGDDEAKLIKKQFDEVIAKQEDVKYWKKIENKVWTDIFYLLRSINYRTIPRTVVLEDGTTMVVYPPKMENKFPQTEEELKEYIEWGAIRGGEVSEYGALYDWYGVPYKWEIFEGGITLSSAGKDKEFGTEDDLVLTQKLDPIWDDKSLTNDKLTDTKNRMVAFASPFLRYGTAEKALYPAASSNLEGGLPRTDEELQLFLEWKLNLSNAIKNRETIIFNPTYPYKSLEDYFGTALKFEIIDEGLKATSAGPDTEFGTDDDIIFRVKTTDSRNGEFLDLDGNALSSASLL